MKSATLFSLTEFVFIKKNDNFMKGYFIHNSFLELVTEHHFYHDNQSMSEKSHHPLTNVIL